MSPHGKRFTRYTLVGIANTVLYVSLLWFFIRWDQFPLTLSVGMAFGLALSFHYLANKYFTFESRSRSLAELVRYFLMASVNYLISLLIVWLCMDKIATSALVASVTSAMVVMIIGYAVSFLWVFR